MPAVKGRKRKSARGGARGKGAQHKTRRRSPKRISLIDQWRETASKYSIAAIAGLSVVIAGIAILLFSSGYFGVLGERTSLAMRNGVAAAGFDVRRVTAVGLDQTNQTDLLDAVGPIIGGSIAHFDLDAARVRVEGLGWVRAAAVTRLWPNTVHVSVREREPAAVWQLSGRLNLIDDSGAVIREVSAFEYSNLPLIVGSGAPETAAPLLQALRGSSALWAETAALIRVGERRWNVRLNSGADVKFPESGLDYAVAMLEDVHTAYGLLDRELEYVDLRNPEQLVYREIGQEETSTP